MAQEDPMIVKSSFFTILFTIITSTFAFASPSNKLVGTLKVKEPIAAIMVDGTTGSIKNGVVTLKYRNAHFWSGLSGSRIIELEQDGKSAAIYLDGINFISFDNFSTETQYDNGQSFELIGREAKVAAGVTYKAASVSCATAGYCTMCQFKPSPDGSLRNICKAGLYENCPGTQEVYGEVLDVTSVPVISIVDKNTQTELGQIIGEPVQRSSFKALRSLSECKAD
jgi:hypothetical protein